MAAQSSSILTSSSSAAVSSAAPSRSASPATAPASPFSTRAMSPSEPRAAISRWSGSSPKGSACPIMRCGRAGRPSNGTCWPMCCSEEAGLDVAHSQPGGFMLCLSEDELDQRRQAMLRLHNQTSLADFPYEILDHAETKRRLPDIGKDVVGSIYSPLDGHVNSLKLFRALREATERRGVDYRPNCTVDSITARDGGFLLSGSLGRDRRRKGRARSRARQCQARTDGRARCAGEAEQGPDHRHREDRALPAQPDGHHPPDRRGRRDDRRQPGGSRLRHHRRPADPVGDGRARGEDVSRGSPG